MGVNLVIPFVGEITLLRILLASIQKYEAGIEFENIIVICSSGNNIKKYIGYLEKSEFIDVVLNYSDGNKQVEDYRIYDRYNKEDASSEFVFYLHADCFPIADGWGKLVYDVAKENKVACFGLAQSGGVATYMDMGCFNVKWVLSTGKSHKYYIIKNIKDFSMFCCRTSYNGYKIGRVVPSPPNSILMENSTEILECAVKSGYHPFVNKDSLYDLSLHNKFFFHSWCGGRSLVQSNLKDSYDTFTNRIVNDLIKHGFVGLLSESEHSLDVEDVYYAKLKKLGVV